MVSVAGFIYDQEEKIILMRHRHWVEDVWSLPGGVVEKGESLQQAFFGGVFEETGLEVSNIQITDFVSGCKKKNGIILPLWSDKNQRKADNFNREQEVIEARVFSFDELT